MIIMEKVIGIRVLKKDAEKTIKKIKEENNFNSKYKIIKEDKHIIIPIKEKKNKEKIIEIKKIEKQKEIGISYKDILSKEKISKEIINKLPSSYDIVGDIVIINLEEIDQKDYSYCYYEKIGKAILKIHPHIKTVLKKEKEHHGTFRTQDLIHIYGEKKKETIIKENGCLLKTDVEKVFYSTRLSTERKRIASLVKENEVVGVFFAGVGPFAIAIAKLSRPKEVIAIELNPVGVKYLKENIIKNKMEDIIKPIKADVLKIYEKYPNYFERIPMPLPKSAEDFLDQAIFCIKNNGIIHIYNFVSKNQPFKKIYEIIKEKEIKNNCKIEVIYEKIIRSFSQTTVQIVMDLKVKKN